MNPIGIAERISQPVSDFLNGNLQLLVDGRWVEAASGKAFPVYNPATGQEIVRIAEADAADVELAVKAARRAFDAGPRI